MERDLADEEYLAYELGELYQAAGWRRFRMRKFEEYAFYLKNRDFLSSQQVITFTDADGRLVALKPDVTLSIVKRYDPDSAGVQKMFYNESVFRVPRGQRTFREIRQVGLEALGDIDGETLAQVVELAARSLQLFGREFVLEISDLSLMNAIFDALKLPAAAREEFLQAIEAKQASVIAQMCERLGIDEQASQGLIAMARFYGTPAQALEEFETLLGSGSTKAAWRAFAEKIAELQASPLAANYRVNFSIVANMTYYDGLAFSGYVSGIPTALISGGEYNRLMRRMAYDAGGVGFAVYLDTAEQLRSADE